MTATMRVKVTYEDGTVHELELTELTVETWHAVQLESDGHYGIKLRANPEAS